MSDRAHSRSDYLIDDGGHAPLTAAAAPAHVHDPHGGAHSHENHHHYGRHHDNAIRLRSFALTVTMMMIKIVAGLFAESLALLPDSLHILLEGSPFDLRGHFEIGHTNFRPEWR